METETSVLDCDPESAHRAYTSYLTTQTSMEGNDEEYLGFGTQVYGGVYVAFTSGVSEVASIVPQKIIRVQRDFAEVDSLSKLRMVWHALIAWPERTKKREIDKSLLQIENQILASLEVDPIEDGCIHPAEDRLEDIIRNFGHQANQWLLDVFTGDRLNMVFKAGILRLLSRQQPFTEEWRYRIIELSLSTSNIELRDAAVQATEAWEDVRAVDLLKYHEEPCVWLADYIKQVIQDLEV